MRIEEHRGRPAGGTSEEILGEIREFCRATQTAESTFGRLVVNDGKLVSRLRDGAKITTGTLDKVRAYLTEHRTASPSAPGKPQPTARPANGSAALLPTLLVFGIIEVTLLISSSSVAVLTPK